jgi:hypothetical protein
MAAFDTWPDAFATHLQGKGRVPPGRWRALGYEPPRRGREDLEREWGDTRTRPGVPPEGSPPDVRQRLGLNRVAILTPGRSQAARNSG